MSAIKKIAAFCCENSGLLAAKHIHDPKILEGIEIIKLPCSGKIEVGLVLKCFEKGFDGVLIFACPLDNCKFIRGNYRAQKRLSTIRQALKEAGIEEERVRMEFISSLDTHKFLLACREMMALKAPEAKKETVQ